MLISFDPFDYEQDADPREAAKAARDAKYRQLKCDSQVYNVRRFTLKHQLEKYQSFGVLGRGYRDVFFVEYRHRSDEHYED